ncbi:MAG: TldD/PmbA family protein [Planctomycetes bacterium]|nr:TldD/PmbA family protein [Planctomycetota bacterium]
MLALDASRALLEQVLRRTQADEAEATLSGLRQDLTRFAENSIHQNVSEENVSVSLRVVFGRRTGRATTGRIDSGSLARLVEAAEAIARLAPEDPDLLPVPDLAEVAAGVGVGAGVAADAASAAAVQAAEDVEPVERARRVGEAIELARASDLTAAGFLTTGAQLLAHANTRGLFAHQAWGRTAFSMTATGADSTGWATEMSPDLEGLPVRDAAERAVRKAVLGRAPDTLPPGEHTVLLEPAAVGDLLEFLLAGFGARQVAEKQSFLTGRVGSRVFGENITLTDDARHPLQSGPVFDGEGLPRERVSLVSRGVAEGLVYDRRGARTAGVRPTGHGLPLPNTLGSMPQNPVLAGGETSLDRMLASTRRGVLVTRCWYNRLVEPMQVVVTGMTRDGTFRVEDGRVVGAVKNVRFNQSVVALLNRVIALGPVARVLGGDGLPAVCPSLLAEGFRFA